ncbi:hypothetical protein HLI01_08670 [Rhizobium laguerreae]|uniref:hypothetical protein n=1 Tax=Rhizobium laguerreae TaxID=1076926 RepID=UPI0014796FED|nr:hypothetical protein [Rhizobium laguerreae]NNH56880.1 hypothetical protein [Rhizobium laguerreae]
MTMNTVREAAQLAAIPFRDPEPLMVEGFGALPVVPPKVAANDNVEGGKRYHSGGIVGGPGGEVPPIMNIDYVLPRAQYEAIVERGQYVGLRRHTDIGARVVVAVEKETAASRPLSSDSGRGPFIQIYPDRKFFPFDPRPDEVFIESIAHGLAHICRYSGAGDRHMSVAEHCTLIARHLAARYDTATALAGLLHDAPEALSGFGDVGRPVKGRAPIISETEDGIYRKAIAPRFGLPLDIPAEVHEADNRIIADEIAANLAPMEWQEKYDGPLGVNIRCWSPEKAEIEFLATFDALTGRKRGMA